SFIKYGSYFKKILPINSVEKFNNEIKNNTPRANLYCLELGPIEVIYDTGSDINAISRYIWNQYPSLQKKYKKKKIVNGANNPVELKDYFELTIIDEADKEYKEIFNVVDNLQESILISNTFAMKLGYELRQPTTFKHQGQDDTHKIDNIDTWNK